MKFILPSSLGFLVFFRVGATAAFFSSAISSVLGGVGLLLADSENEEGEGLDLCRYCGVGEAPLKVKLGHGLSN